MMNMKVLQVLPGLKTDGIAVVVTNYYKFIDKTKVQFDFAVENKLRNKYDDYIEHNGGKIFRLPCHSSSLLNPIRYISALKQLVKRGDYKAVHIHGNSSLPLFLAAFAVKLSRKKVKVIFSSHARSCEQPLLHKFFYPLIKKIADYRFACSTPAGIHMYGKQSFEILANGIDFQKYRYNAEIREKKRAELFISDNFVIGFSGRISPPKNPLFLIDVYKILKQSLPSAKLLICGDGLMMDELQKKIEHEKVDGVICMGSVTSTENYLSAMDVLLMPSLYEGLPIALLEAQANGLLSICSENIPEEAIYSDTVSVIPLNEKNNWVERIKAFAKETIRKPFLGDPAITGYDINIESKKLLNFYLSLL